MRGAAPGTRETDLLRSGNLVEEVHAIVLSGGSAYGLDAASGVMRYLEERGIGFKAGDNVIPIVPAAILIDFGIGTARRPGAAEGYRAASNASGGAVEEGSVGAGTGATVAKSAGRDRMLKGGLGTASEQLDTGVVVAALAAVNAVGSIFDPRTGEVVAAPRADGSGFIDLDAHFRRGERWSENDDGGDGSGVAPGTNTTLAVVATNATLTKTQTNRLATVAQDGLARSIWPVHTQGDGDTMFALATGEQPLAEGAYSSIEAMAVRAVERAILRAVRLATGLGGVPSASEWLASSGR